MEPTTNQILEIETFFNGINIPKVVKIDAASTQNDAPKFVKESIPLLKSRAIVPQLAGLRYQMLLNLKAAILDPAKAG